MRGSAVVAVMFVTAIGRPYCYERSSSLGWSSRGRPGCRVAPSYSPGVPGPFPRGRIKTLLGAVYLMAFEYGRVPIFITSKTQTCMITTAKPGPKKDASTSLALYTQGRKLPIRMSASLALDVCDYKPRCLIWDSSGAKRKRGMGKAVVSIAHPPLPISVSYLYPRGY